MRRYIVIITAGFLLFLLMASPLRQIYAPVRYRELLKHYADKYNLDWRLVSSIVYHESRFRYKAVSNKGAVGLMQIMPETGREIARKLGWQDFSLENLFSPIVNLEFGCYYFNCLLKEFNNDTRMALAAYNAGKGTIYKCYSARNSGLNSVAGAGVAGYPDIKNYLCPETRNYVNGVNNTYKLLKLLDKVWKL